MSAKCFLFLILFTLTGCNHLFYFPTADVYYPPENLKLKYEKVAFKSADGTALTAWFIPTVKKKVKGTIVQFHGNAENMTSHYMSLVWLVQEGYNLFTFDYRGYGASAGKPTQKGTVEDGVAAISEALKKHSGGAFIVWGQSLGGAILQASLERVSDLQKVDLIILESTFTSYRKVAASLFKRGAVTWFLVPLTYVLISDRHAGMKFLENNHIPVLIVHDEHDQTVPYENGLDIYNRTRAKKTFWSFTDGAHTRGFSPDRPENRKKLVEFLGTLTK